MNSLGTNNPELFLGIDAGGSKTEAWLGHRNPEGVSLLGKGLAGPANLTVDGLDKAGQQVLLATERAFAAANLPRSQTTRACLCLAGCGRNEERQQVQQWAFARRLGLDVMVCSDAEILLAASRPLESTEIVSAGIGLIAGTGSIAWGRADDGRTMRCGGWGPLLGDEGSGYAIAVSALKAVCTIADGRDTDPVLLAEVLSAIDRDSVSQIVPWAYASSRSRDELASLAPMIFAIADSSPIAQHIIHQASDALAQQVSNLVHRLQLENYFLAVAGGVLVNQVDYRQLLQQHLHRLDCPPAKIGVVLAPVLGALRIAALSHPKNR